MQIVKPLLVAAAALIASQAHAGLSVSSTDVPVGNYVAGTVDMGATNTSVQTTSVTGQYLQPLNTTGSFLVVSSLNGDAGSATIEADGASSYSFVWGSPDAYNVVDVYGSNGSFEEYTGTMLMYPDTADGDNSNSKLVTISGTGGTTIDYLVFKSSGVAFETAVAAVPEPETYALMLAGLGALGFMARRRNRA